MALARDDIHVENCKVIRWLLGKRGEITEFLIFKCKILDTKTRQKAKAKLGGGGARL